MPNYTYICPGCEATTVANYPMAARPETTQCEECGAQAEYQLTGTGLVIREAYLDGTRRAGWSDLREASALNKQIAAQSDSEERGRIAQQIRDLGIKVKQ